MVLGTGSPPASGLLLNLAISENRHDSFVDNCHGRQFFSWKKQHGMKILKGMLSSMSPLCLGKVFPTDGFRFIRQLLHTVHRLFSTCISDCFIAYLLYMHRLTIALRLQFNSSDFHLISSTS